MKRFFSCLKKAMCLETSNLHTHNFKPRDTLMTTKLTQLSKDSTFCRGSNLVLAGTRTHPQGYFILLAGKQFCSLHPLDLMSGRPMFVRNVTLLDFLFFLFWGEERGTTQKVISVKILLIYKISKIRWTIKLSRFQLRKENPFLCSCIIGHWCYRLTLGDRHRGQKETGAVSSLQTASTHAEARGEGLAQKEGWQITW